MELTRAGSGGAAAGLARWRDIVLFAALLALALGTVLAIAGVTVSALFMPGIYGLEFALLLLAAAGILAVVGRDA